jgi:hypothetical protein
MSLGIFLWVGVLQDVAPTALVAPVSKTGCLCQFPNRRGEEQLSLTGGACDDGQAAGLETRDTADLESALRR